MLIFKCNIFLLFLIQTIVYITCKASNEDVSKAMACMSILATKFKGESPDPRKYSSMLLKCFITITEEEAKEVLVGIEQGIQSIEEKEIEKLTDFSTLNNIPKKELDEYSNQLQNAINTFRKIQENYNSDKKDKDYDTDDEDFKKSHPSRGNTLGSFMKKMTGILKTINNMGSVILIIIFLYFGLIMFRKFCDNGKNRNKYKDKNQNKIKDKKNKDKKIKKKTE